MQKNWYIIFIKPLSQKKLIFFCKRKNIEHYFVASSNMGRRDLKGESSNDPIVHSLFFIKASEAMLPEIKKIEAVFNIMYWQNKPAIVRDEEIAAIKDFTLHYNNIKVKRTFVDTEGEIQNISVPLKGIEGNVYSISYKTIKLNLPSLGIAMMADIKRPSSQKNTFDFPSRSIQQQM